MVCARLPQVNLDSPSSVMEFDVAACAAWAELLSSESCGLQALGLKDNLIGDEALVAFSAGLRSNRSLETLTLAKVAGDEGIASVCEALVANPSSKLRNLVLQGVAKGKKWGGLQENATAALQALLASAVPLGDLDVRDRNVDAAGCARIAAGLKSNTRVDLLNLELNPLGDEGAKALAESVSRQPFRTKVPCGHAC